MIRGQVTIEYLTILIAVVITALLAIGVLGEFPGMTSDSTLSNFLSYGIHATVGLLLLIHRGNTFRRGQAAIEYLIILAVVVIIALIVVGVVGGFPTMTRGVSASSSANYWASADIGITRYFISAGSPNSSMLVIRNNRMFTVNVTNITMGGSLVNVTTGQSLAPGASASVFLKTGSPGCTSGGTYSWTTVINYTDATYGSTYTFTGDTPLVGTCQR